MADSLQPFDNKPKSFKPLDPSNKPIVAELAALQEKNPAWKLVINVPVEIDL